MLAEIGKKEMAKLEQDRQVTVKAYDHYVSLIPKYEKILDEISGNDKKQVTDVRKPEICSTPS